MGGPQRDLLRFDPHQQHRHAHCGGRGGHRWAAADLSPNMLCFAFRLCPLRTILVGAAADLPVLVYEYLNLADTFAGLNE